jgi:hypothetical protein
MAAFALADWHCAQQTHSLKFFLKSCLFFDMRQRSPRILIFFDRAWDLAIEQRFAVKIL